MSSLTHVSTLESLGLLNFKSVAQFSKVHIRTAPNRDDLRQYFAIRCIFIMADITDRRIFVLVIFWVVFNWIIS